MGPRLSGTAPKWDRAQVGPGPRLSSASAMAEPFWPPADTRRFYQADNAPGDAPYWRGYFRPPARCEYSSTLFW